MPSLLIKDFPSPLHKKLKQMALKNQRSMTRQALILLENGLKPSETPPPLPQPFKASTFITQKWLNKAKRMGQR